MRTQQIRQNRIYQDKISQLSKQCDRIFFFLLLGQGIFSVAWVQWQWPDAWAHSASSLDHSIYTIALLGVITNLPSWTLISRMPGRAVTRNAIAITQILWSGIFFYISESHHTTYLLIFGSMAALALYRDWVVLLTAATVAASGHIAATYFSSMALYGIQTPQWSQTFVDLAWLSIEEVALIFSAAALRREMVMDAGNKAMLEEVLHSSEAGVSQRTLELTESQEQYKLIAEAANVIPFTFRRNDRRFIYMGPQAVVITGYTNSEWLMPGFLATRIDKEQENTLNEIVGKSGGTKFEAELIINAKNNRRVYLRCCAKVFEENGEIFSRGIFLDISERRALETDLASAQKLEAVGRLASGIAHEINTPIQFISDSVHFVREVHQDVNGLWLLYRAVCKKVIAGQNCLGDAQAAQERDAELATEELAQDVPQALDRAIDGIERITRIVRSMKEFAHPDQSSATAVDLNQAISSTLIIANNEVKYVADLVTEFADIPHVVCYAGEINQVVLNLIINAVHAIAEKTAGTNNRGQITVSTERDGDFVSIKIVDTGNGIPKAVQNRIFDPFFTTKEVGRGTGQGLAIARTVIQKHGGTITFETKESDGTSFTVKLRITGPVPADLGKARL